MKHETLFSKYVKELSSPTPDGEAKGLCPFHSDENPSFGVNLLTGKWRCYAGGCGKQGGVKKFKVLVGETNEVKPIPEEEIDAYHRALMGAPKTLAYLREERFLSLEIIERYKLGYDGDRILIPIRDVDGMVVNVRKYLKDGAQKMVSYAKGYGKARLFPIDQLQHSSLIVGEGEFDTLLAIDRGHPTITQTGGAGTWTAEFTRALAGKDITLAYDADDAGAAGIALVAPLLMHVATVAVADLTPYVGPGNDITDIVAAGGDLGAALANVAPYEPVMVDDSPDDKVYPVHLSESSFSDHAFRRISTSVVVAGKDLAPYTVPFRIKYECEMGEKRCSSCGIAQRGGTWDFEFKEWQQELLQMINTSKKEVLQVISDVAHVPGRCRKFDYEVVEFVNIEAIKCIPEIDWSTEESPYVIRQLFFFGHGLESNRSYKLEAIAMPDPKTQYATALIYDAELAESNIDAFRMTPELLSHLEVFQP